jgi:hypothetical protein
MAKGDGAVASLFAEALALGLSYTETMTMPLTLIVTALRHKRRSANGLKGFGWIALDALQERKFATCGKNG